MATISKDVKTTPAGENDNFKIVGVDINNIIEFDKYVLKTGRRVVEREDLSTDLQEGMSLKVESNKDVIVIFEERKNNKNAEVINFEESKMEKEDNDRAM